MRRLDRVGVTAVLAAVLLASPAMAANHPTGEFAQFRDCPLKRETISSCFRSVSTAGSFTVGKKTVPIENPVVLQGGIEGAGESVKFFAAEDGHTLSRAPQPVPGGLRGVNPPKWWPESLQEWFNDEVDQGMTDVKASLELAAPPTAIKLSTENLAYREGVALGLPAKFRLESPILGSNCYIGANSSPVRINFTTGRSGAIRGAAPPAQFNKNETLTAIRNGRLVNSTFEAPAASGCGGILSFFIDPLVNGLLGGSSESGGSAAILEGNFEGAVAGAVRASESRRP
jgi:hypothetical protein